MGEPECVTGPFRRVTEGRELAPFCALAPRSFSGAVIAADKLRNNMDAAEYKHVILPHLPQVHLRRL